MIDEPVNLFGAVMFFVALCLVKAFAEIEMEGADGWAAKSATAYARRGTWLARVHELFMGGRPLSYWNVSEQVFFVLVWHVPFATATHWLIADELYMVTWMVAWMMIYDWCWFLFHPLRNRQQTWSGRMFQGAWWHPTRLQRMLPGYPADYPRIALVVCGLCGAYGWLCGSWLAGARLFSIFPLSIGVMLIIHALFAARYHDWYHAAHASENDGRSDYIPLH